MIYVRDEMMKQEQEYTIQRIKIQMLADVTMKIMEKYDFVTFQDIEEIASKVRSLLLLVFGEQCNEEGGKILEQNKNTNE